MKELLINTKFLEWEDISDRGQELIFRDRLIDEFIDNPEHSLWEKEMAIRYGVDECVATWDGISLDFDNSLCPTISSHMIRSVLSKTLPDGTTIRASANSVFKWPSNTVKDIHECLHNLQQIAKEIDEIHLPKHISQTTPQPEPPLSTLKSLLYQRGDDYYTVYDQAGNCLWQVQI